MTVAANFASGADATQTRRISTIVVRCLPAAVADQERTTTTTTTTATPAATAWLLRGVDLAADLAGDLVELGLDVGPGDRLRRWTGLTCRLPAEGPSTALCFADAERLPVIAAPTSSTTKTIRYGAHDQLPLKASVSSWRRPQAGDRAEDTPKPRSTDPATPKAM